jgi:hypothetical protein
LGKVNRFHGRISASLFGIAGRSNELSMVFPYKRSFSNAKEEDGLTVRVFVADRPFSGRVQKAAGRRRLGVA